MRRLRHGRTTVVIAHRLTGVIDADQIAVIEAASSNQAPFTP